MPSGRTAAFGACSETLFAEDDVAADGITEEGAVEDVAEGPEEEGMGSGNAAPTPCQRRHLERPRQLLGETFLLSFHGAAC